MSAHTAARNLAAHGPLVFIANLNAAIVLIGALSWGATGSSSFAVQVLPVALVMVWAIARVTGDVRTLQGLGALLALASGLVWALSNGGPWAVLFAGGIALLLQRPGSPAGRGRRR